MFTFTEFISEHKKNKKNHVPLRQNCQKIQIVFSWAARHNRLKELELKSLKISIKGLLMYTLLDKWSEEQMYKDESEEAKMVTIHL